MPSWNLRLRPDEEAVGQAVGRAPHLARGKSIHRVRLVAAARHQRGEGQLHALRGVALEDEAVERIEGEEVLIVEPRSGRSAKTCRPSARSDRRSGNAENRPDRRGRRTADRPCVSIRRPRLRGRGCEQPASRVTPATAALGGQLENATGANRACVIDRIRVARRIDARPRSRSRLRRLRGVPPPHRRERPAAVFRHRIGMAEAVPARGAHFAVGPLRHDVVIPQQHAIERLGGGDEIGAALGEDRPGRSCASTAGFLMPIRLSEPGWSAACEPQ